MSDAQFVVHETKAELSAAVARRLAEEIVAAQRARGIAHLVLTGGSMGGGTLAGLRDQPGPEIDWSTVHFWWGDERFVPLGDKDRNDVEARDALLDHIDVPEVNVHVMAPSGGPVGDDVDAGAAAYARELARHAAPDSEAQVPAFDVLMLGVGPDAHIASLFPQHPAQRIVDATAIPVRESPKPPPLRISLSYPAINAARQVWFLVSGEEKAQAVARATSPDADRWDYPASGAAGTDATIWWLDEAAASQLPRH